MTPKYREEVNKLLAGLDDEEPKQQKEAQSSVPPQPEIKREIHYIFVHEVEDEESEDFVVDSDLADLDTEPLPIKPQPQPVTNATSGVLALALFLPLLCIAVQLYFILNPYTVTVTLLAKAQHITLSGTLQLGRGINPITLSQSATAHTTGHGHQDAQQATGSITFYNGQSTQVTVPAGTTVTGGSGEQVVTDADATIPPLDLTTTPPSVGQVTVLAHAVNKGTAGNIPAYDISQLCCFASGAAKNTAPFHGGTDERNFQTVAKSDISNAAAPLQTTLDQSMQNTLAGQLKSGEALTSQHCTTTTTTDHQAGDEATQIKVTVSETCSGVAYNQATLQAKMTQLLSSQALKKFGTGYSMLDNPQVLVTSARAQGNAVFFSFTAQSAWIYGISPTEQHAIKQLIAGKTTEKALQLLAALPGIERVALQSSAFGDSSQIPKALSSIQLALFYG